MGLHRFEQHGPAQASSRQPLLAVFSRFTEGFDLPDLAADRALPEESVPAPGAEITSSGHEPMSRR